MLVLWTALDPGEYQSHSLSSLPPQLLFFQSPLFTVALDLTNITLKIFEHEKMRETGDIYSYKGYSLENYITMRKTMMLWLWTCIICGPKQFTLIRCFLAHIIFIPIIQEKVENEKRSFNLPPIPKLVYGRGRMHVGTSEDIIPCFPCSEDAFWIWEFQEPIRVESEWMCS